MRSGDSNAADYLMAEEDITDALGREVKRSAAEFLDCVATQWQ